MSRKIEFIPVTNPLSLKETLEEMVNGGWELKGFVSFNQGMTSEDSFAVLESLAETGKTKILPQDAEEPIRISVSNTASLKKKEISISVGGN